MQTGPVGAAAAARAPSTGSEPPSEGGSAGGKGDPFDVWLRCRLHRSYGATAAEPIPEELLRLIKDDGKV
jgi:hypothetical protein